MSDTLSTLIAFVGFLILLSMLVQSFQEGLKSLFKLKTGVYERFFIALYREEFFKPVRDTGLPAQTVQIKPSSFWEIFRSAEFIGEFDKRMERLKKVVDQTGRILKETRYALRTVADLVPSSPDYPQKLTAGLQPAINALAKVSGLRLDLVLTIYDQFNGGRISQFYKILSDFKEKFALPLEAIAAEELKKCPEAARQVLALLADIERLLLTYRLQIEERMDAWLAQLNEVYRRNMLKWTVALGAAIVFIFNADAFTVYRYLSTHNAARAVIAQKVEGVVVHPHKAKAEDLNRINDLMTQNKGKDAKELILTFSAGLAADLEAYGKEDKARLARTVRKETEALRVDPPSEQAMESLRAKTGDLAVLYVNLQKTSFDRQVETLSSLDLPLGWVEDWERLKRIAGHSEGLIFGLRKIGGLILTVFLITFGAPFWNDVLSALAGIKNRAVKEGKPGDPEKTA